MALGDAGDRLSCGRSIDEVWSRVGLPLDAHERDCEQCQAARASLGALAELTQDLQHSEELGEEYRPRGGVKAAVMRVARAEIRRGHQLPVLVDEQGAVLISEQTVSAVVRFAADGVAGVRARRCAVGLLAGEAGGEGPTPIEVTVRLALHSSAAIVETTAAVRERVEAVTRAQTGLVVRRIDVIVEDLYDV